jgi:hypothetical protein
VKIAIEPQRRSVLTANRTTDQGARATLLLMAQKWLDLASEKFGARRFGGLLDDFNEQQMLDRPKT